MIIAVVIFVVGSAIQAGAVSIGMLFVGEFGRLISEMGKRLMKGRSSNCRLGGGDVDDGHPVVYF